METSLKDLMLPQSGGYIVLLSGGLDSSVLTHVLYRRGLRVKALNVLYGQRHSREREAATRIAQELGIECVCLDLCSIRPILGTTSSLLNSEVAIPLGHYEDASMQSTVVPNRNMLLLSLAAAWSVASSYDGVAYAAHGGDHAIYPDCRPEFASAMDAAIRLCDYREQHLLRPFVNITKADIVKLGSAAGVPLEHTWSCYNGRDRHCGKCGTCVERREAFQLAGVPDPTAYEA